MYTQIYNPKELRGLEDLLTDAKPFRLYAYRIATLKFQSLTPLNENLTQKNSIKFQCMSRAYPSWEFSVFATKCPSFIPHLFQT